MNYIIGIYNLCTINISLSIYRYIYILSIIKIHFFLEQRTLDPSIFFFYQAMNRHVKATLKGHIAYDSNYIYIHVNCENSTGASSCQEEG